MWMRREATTRRPASSSMLVIAPVRLRRVASGLMIEKVRSVAMAERAPYLQGWIGRLSKRCAASGQAYRRRTTPSRSGRRDAIPDDDAVAHAHRLIEQSGELAGKANAAARCGIVGEPLRAVKRDAVIGQTQHVRHRRVVEVGA